MIITKLKGGLGNQMFQYATGRMLSQKTKASLFLDTSWFSNTKKDMDRNFDLNKLNIISEEVKYNPGLVEKFINLFNQKILRKYYFDFEPELMKKSEEIIIQNKNIYLDGYFQSEKNFTEIRNILLEEFSLKEEFKSPKFKELQNEIRNKNSVSIHIRRGDYIKNHSVTKYHGICSIDYYKSAMKLISEKSSETPSFYFFSDDPQWVSDNFELNENAKIISNQNLSAVEELFLMSSCKHNIIANSTFSWWSAWLNQNHDKIVISPIPWVDKLPNTHPNIIPETWIKIPKNH